MCVRNLDRLRNPTKRQIEKDRLPESDSPKLSSNGGSGCSRRTAMASNHSRWPRLARRELAGPSINANITAQSGIDTGAKCINGRPTMHQAVVRIVPILSAWSSCSAGDRLEPDRRSS